MFILYLLVTNRMIHLTYNPQEIPSEKQKKKGKKKGDKHKVIFFVQGDYLTPRVYEEITSKIWGTLNNLCSMILKSMHHIF